MVKAQPSTVAAGVMHLVPVAGPAMEPLRLEPKPGGLTLGRHEQCDIRLPADADKVSRFHLRFNYDNHTFRWRVVDLGSRWGTLVNGQKIATNVETLLSEGDLIRITPWTFSFGSVAKRRGMISADDAGQTMVRTIADPGGAPGRGLREDMLALLLEAAATIYSADTEAALAERLIDTAVRGTGLPNAAVLRPLDTSGRVEVISSRMNAGLDGGAVSFSRSLLNAAAGGQVAEISSTSSDVVSQSIVSMNITAALCVPLMLGPAPAAFLYLDARSGAAGQQSLRPAASAFCVALGRIASLALANLKRVEMEKRQAMIVTELNAAAAAQKWILPKRITKIHSLACVGESRAGQYVGGDFFDLVDLGDNRVAVALGDVSGKGVSASVLMTATQGFLHAALQRHVDPGKAVTDANKFVCPRRPESRFVTMWVGIFDLNARTLRYVDAGHGYAVLQTADGECVALDEGGGVPVGVMDEYDYIVTTVALPPGGRVLVVSDGIVEQFGIPAGADVPEQFEMTGVRTALGPPTEEDGVARVFSAVIAHAKTDKLSDDATAVLVRWEF